MKHITLTAMLSLCLMLTACGGSTDYETNTTPMAGAMTAYQHATTCDVTTGADTIYDPRTGVTTYETFRIHSLDNGVTWMLRECYDDV